VSDSRRAGTQGARAGVTVGENERGEKSEATATEDVRNCLERGCLYGSTAVVCGLELIPEFTSNRDQLSILDRGPRLSRAGDWVE
jgi:hypothetical protein